MKIKKRFNNFVQKTLQKQVRFNLCKAPCGRQYTRITLKQQVQKRAKDNSWPWCLKY